MEDEIKPPAVATAAAAAAETVTGLAEVGTGMGVR